MTTSFALKLIWWFEELDSPGISVNHQLASANIDFQSNQGEALDISVKIKGGSDYDYLFQLDTGADISLVYIESRLSENLRFTDKYATADSCCATEGQKLLGTETLSLIVCGNKLVEVPFYVSRGYGNTDGDASGTIGVDFLKNRYSVLDYSNQRLLVLTEDEFNSQCLKDNVTLIELNENRLQPVLPIDIRGLSTNALFDTGSSSCDLIIPADKWSLITGADISDPTNHSFETNSWNRKIKVVHGKYNIPITIFGETFITSSIHCCPELDSNDFIIGNNLFLGRRIFFDFVNRKIGISTTAPNLSIESDHDAPQTEFTDS